MSEDVKTLIQEAENAYTKKDWDAAIDLYTSVQNLDPFNEDACSKLAEIYAIRGLISELIREYFHLMDILEGKEEYELAVEVARWIMKIQPDNDNARKRIILIFKMKGDMDEVVNQSLQLARLYIELGQGDQSILLLKSAQEIAPSNLDIGLELAEMYISHGHIQEGTNQYRKIANAYLDQKNYEKAAEAFRRMKVVVPDDALLLYTLGNVYVNLNELNKAEAEFRAILRLDINHTDALKALGNVCQKKGQFRDAILAFNKILSINPQDVFAKERLGELYHDQGATGEAVKYYIDAANYYQYHDEQDRAIRLYQRVLTIDPTNPTSCRELTNMGAPLIAEEQEEGKKVYKSPIAPLDAVAAVEDYGLPMSEIGEISYSDVSEDLKSFENLMAEAEKEISVNQVESAREAGVPSSFLEEKIPGIDLDEEAPGEEEPEESYNFVKTGKKRKLKKKDGGGAEGSKKKSGRKSLKKGAEEDAEEPASTKRLFTRRGPINEEDFEEVPPVEIPEEAFGPIIEEASIEVEEGFIPEIPIGGEEISREEGEPEFYQVDIPEESLEELEIMEEMMPEEPGETLLPDFEGLAEEGGESYPLVDEFEEPEVIPSVESALETEIPSGIDMSQEVVGEAVAEESAMAESGPVKYRKKSLKNKLGMNVSVAEPLGEIKDAESFEETGISISQVSSFGLEDGLQEELEYDSGAIEYAAQEESFAAVGAVAEIDMGSLEEIPGIDGEEFGLSGEDYAFSETSEEIPSMEEFPGEEEALEPMMEEGEVEVPFLPESPEDLESFGGESAEISEFESGGGFFPSGLDEIPEVPEALESSGVGVPSAFGKAAEEEIPVAPSESEESEDMGLMDFDDLLKLAEEIENIIPDGDAIRAAEERKKAEEEAEARRRQEEKEAALRRREEEEAEALRRQEEELRRMEEESLRQIGEEEDEFYRGAVTTPLEPEDLPAEIGEEEEERVSGTHLLELTPTSLLSQETQMLEGNLQTVVLGGGVGDTAPLSEDVQILPEEELEPSPSTELMEVGEEEIPEAVVSGEEGVETSESEEEVVEEVVIPEETVLDKALNLMEDDDVGGALSLLEEALTEDPENDEILGEYAEICYQYGLAENSINAYKKILVGNPGDMERHKKVIRSYLLEDRFDDAVDSLLEYGHMMLGSDEVEEAQRAFQNVLALQSENLQARESLSEIYLNQDQKQVSLYHLNILVQHLEESEAGGDLVRVLRKIFNLTNNIEVQKKMIDVYVKNDLIDEAIVEIEALAQRYLRQDEIFKAIENYEKIVQMDSKNISAHRNLANLYQEAGNKERSYNESVIVADLLVESGDTEKAVEIYNDCLSSKHFDQNVRNKLVNLYIQIEDFDLALEEAKVLTESLHRERRYDEAINIYLKLLEHSPENLFLREKLAEFYIVAGLLDKGFENLNVIAKELESQEDWESAVKTYRKALTISEKDSDIHFRLGEILLDKLGNKSEALEQFLKVVEYDSGNKAAHENLLELYLEMDRPAEAIKVLNNLIGMDENYTSQKESIIDDYKAKVEADPQDFKSHYNLGIIYMHLSMWKEAIEQFQVARKSKEYILRAHNMLGLCFAQQKAMLGLAIKTLEKGLEVKGFEEKDYVDLRYNLGELYEKIGKFDLAASMYEAVLLVDPTYNNAQDKLIKVKEKLEQ